MRRTPVRLAAVLLSVPLVLGTPVGPAQAAAGAPAGPAAPARDPFVPLVPAPGGDAATSGTVGPDPAAAPPPDGSVPGGSSPATELPRTGPHTGPLTGLAAVLLGTGAVLVRAGARRHGTSASGTPRLAGQGTTVGSY